MGTRQKSSETWPFGEFLRKHRGNMTVAEAARRADISESRWRQIELGHQKMGGGLTVPAVPRAETAAAMCRAVGADVKEGLELAGYNAQQYAWLLSASAVLESTQALDWFTALPRQEREEVLAELQRLHLDTELQQRSKGKRAAG